MSEQKIAKGSGEKILVTDDDPGITDSVAQYLELEGFRTSRCYRGKDCLDKAKTERPDLIILDIGLPDLDGFQVMEALKKEKTLLHIPVVILTANIKDEDQLKGWQKGAAHYITKPFDMGELVNAVLLALSERRREIQNKIYDIE